GFQPTVRVSGYPCFAYTASTASFGSITCVSIAQFSMLSSTGFVSGFSGFGSRWTGRPLPSSSW
ncbi:MAG: hypothetical protein AAB368_10885, partial [bacterium]